MKTWLVVVQGAPRTKKNHSVLVAGRAIILPSEPWREWDRVCGILVADGDHPVPRVPPELAVWRDWVWTWKKPRRRKKGAPPPKVPHPPKPPTFVPAGVRLNCRATFYRDTNAGDAVGFYQGVADILESHGILENDRQLVSWDGSRLRKDPERPRVEIVLEESPEDLFPMLPDEEPEDSEVGLGYNPRR